MDERPGRRPADPSATSDAAGFFEPRGTSLSPAQRRTHALYDMAYTAVDFLAAVFFIVGSIFFFSEDLMTAGTWLFLIGSILFAVRPTLTLAREIHLLRQSPRRPDDA